MSEVLNKPMVVEDHTMPNVWCVTLNGDPVMPAAECYAECDSEDEAMSMGSL